MENWEILLDKKETYIIGVSGGPDSMALLDMCKKQGYSLVVAHMNYQKRDSALRDEEIVRKYCEENGKSYTFINDDEVEINGKRYEIYRGYENGSRGNYGIKCKEK